MSKMSEGVDKMANTMNEKVIIYKMGMVIPKDVTKIVCDPSVTMIEARAFEHCTKLMEVVLNEGLIKIGFGAFKGCGSLTGIKLPSTVTMIEAHAFKSCTNLKEVSLNEGLKRIGQGEGCDNAREEFRLIDQGLEIISGGAFDGCPLEHVKFPDLSMRVKNLVAAGQSDIPDKIAVGYNKKCALKMAENLAKLVSTMTVRPPRFSSLPSARELENKPWKHYLEWNGDGLVVSALGLEGCHDSSQQHHSTWPPPPGPWYEDWAGPKDHLDYVLSLVSHYELKAAISTIELAMWKANIEEMGAVTLDERNACRVDIPGPAKDAIFQFLK